MTCRNPFLYACLLAALVPVSQVAHGIPSSEKPTVIVSTAREPIAPGKFAPTWQSLQQYEVPIWFRDAKFGIWAHWGPQCQPERGDWYARNLYFEDGPAWGTNVTAFHRETYGHPSQAGFKDVIHQWHAEKWDPDKLVALYKRAGAEYFLPSPITTIISTSGTRSISHGTPCAWARTRISSRVGRRRPTPTA